MIGLRVLVRPATVPAIRIRATTSRSEIEVWRRIAESFLERFAGENVDERGLNRFGKAPGVDRQKSGTLCRAAFADRRTIDFREDLAFAAKDRANPLPAFGLPFPFAVASTVAVGSRALRATPADQQSGARSN